MHINRFVPLKDLLGVVRRREDRNGEYSVYWKDEADDPALNEAVLVSAPVTVEDDRDVFPQIVVENGYWIFCSDQILQDVVDAALGENSQVSDEKLREALLHYLRTDNFLDVTDGQ